VNNDRMFSVIIPAFGEEETLAHCIYEVVKTLNGGDMNYEIIVVDDGSPDRTLDLAQEVAKNVQAEVNVIHHASNMGKGRAVMTGVAFAKSNNIIVQDADLEYHPKEIPKLIEPLLKGETYIVYGSRFLGHIDCMKPSHYFGNKILTFMVNLLYNCKLTDVMTGYKAFQKDILNQVNINSNSFEFEVEVTSKMIESGFKITEIPISYTRRKLGRSKIGWVDGLKCLLWLIRRKFYLFLNAPHVRKKVYEDIA
jgi:glycosyltransferase involved in cell wall biosynthesis